MAVLIGVALISTAGWLLSLTSPRSAARRHLILTTTLTACVLWPVALAVRSSTDWTLLAIPRSAKVQAPMDGEQAWPLLEHFEEHNLAQASETHSDVARQEPIAARPAAPTSQSDVVKRSPPRRSAHVRLAAAVSTTQTRWPEIVYGVIAGAMLLRIFASFVALWRVRRQAVAIDKTVTGIAVLEANVPVPLAIGFGGPAILLPRGFLAAIDRDELNDVLAHEAEHLRRKDHWVMLLQAITAAAYWPVVTVHLLNRALIRAREELCDNAVLAKRDPAAYGQTLLAVAERAAGRRTFVAQLAPSVLRRGELERRVAGMLDNRRDRRTAISRRASTTVAAGLVLLAAMAGTTRVVAIADETSTTNSNPSDAKVSAAPRSEPVISWTGIPKIDEANPALHRGVVLSPEGKPLAGATIYAASTIELFEMAESDEVGIEDLGPVRAVTDAEGRFQFTAEDLTWVTPAGERKRWETLLVATKEGLPPAWLKTWGADRTFREHWHPWKQREVAIRTRPPATVTGRLLLEGGAPLAGARVRLTGLMAPIEYDLNKHIPKEEEDPLSLFETIDYAEAIYRPHVLPGLNLEATTGEDGRFELRGLPEGFIADIEITHPDAVTQGLRVAVRKIEPVYRKPDFGGGEPTLTLYGSGFTKELPKGAVLRGQVSAHTWMSPGNHKAAGVIVAQANHNAKDGMWGQRFKTDADGRFEMTGLPNRPQGFELAFAGSFAAPYASRRQQIVPGEDARVELMPATPYRLKLLDASGAPVDREVYSVEVQSFPGDVRRGVKSHFNQAEQAAPGVYEGIVPRGPGAVLVKRGAKSDRPAAVNPKEFFAPGRSDWTPEEQRFAYGDAWRIAQPAVVETEALSVGHNPTTEQLELAAIVLTNAKPEDGVLELTATVFTNPPVQVTLVDEAGQPVHGAKLERQLKRYNDEDLPATFPVHGLHPQRAEFLRFTHETRGLIATLTATWSPEPLRVVMQPAATLTGQVTNAKGTPNDDFWIRVSGEGVMPDTMVGGDFRLVVPPGQEVRGEFVRKLADYATRPTAGVAFGPLTPKPGETVQLGNLVAP